MKTATNFLLLSFLAFTLAGCMISPSTLLVNEEGNVQRCSAYGYGLDGAPMAQQIHDSCVNDFRKLGYVELPEVIWGVRSQMKEKKLVVLEVKPASSAELSGILAGDIIEEIDGIKIKSNTQIDKYLLTKKGRDKISVKISRNGNILNLTSELRSR